MTAGRKENPPGFPQNIRISFQPTPATEKHLRCPECGSHKIWKDGLRRTKLGPVQRYLCRECGLRFSDPTTKLTLSNHSKVLVENRVSCRRQSLNTVMDYTIKRRVCATETKGAKNSASLQRLGVMEKTVLEDEKRAAGATEKDIKSILFNFSWWMKKQGYAEQTIEGRTKLLKILVKRGADLYDPESVKEVIAKQRWSEGRKENAVLSYSTFLRMIGREWVPPRYKRVDKLPWIPTEKEVDQLIAGCSKRVATFLQLLKETGMRPGEAWKLRWIDVDFERNTVIVTPEKNSNPRIFKLSGKLIAMLKALPVKNDYVFRSGSLRHLADNFRKQRKRIAYKLKNPRIKRISFKTLRHFKATMEYAKTKDILHVKEILGHKNINNTLKYTHLVNFKTDEYISKAAKTVEEAQKLIEAGFEYVCDFDGVKLFRKRK